MRKLIILFMIVQLFGNVGSVEKPALRYGLLFPMLLQVGTSSRICKYLRCTKELVPVGLPPQD
jgi:hypothetical protein